MHALAAELVRARADAGEDPARLIADAIEDRRAGADREQAGAAAEVEQDLEHASREVERLGQTSRQRRPSSRPSGSRPSGPTAGT